jgi:hypothetical protein
LKTLVACSSAINNRKKQFYGFRPSLFNKKRRIKYKQLILFLKLLLNNQMKAELVNDELIQF